MNQLLATALFVVLSLNIAFAPAAASTGNVAMQHVQTDLLIVGGTESGWAAAIQAARLGVGSITVVHDGEWLGGQFTEQALACVDENKGVGKTGWGVHWHPMKRSFHRSGLFRELMDEIEAHNKKKYGAPMPGRPYHGPSTFRPYEAERIFRRMLQPYVDSGQVSLITNHYPVAATVDRSGKRSRLTGISFASLGAREATLHVSSRMTIDASDWGEAIQVSKAAFECGPDPQARYHEPSAPADLSGNPPNEMNPITWAMIVVESEEEALIPRPARFDNRNYPRATFLSLKEFRGLKWERSNPGLGAIRHWPDAGQAAGRQLTVYTVRRLIDGTAAPDGQTVILLNYMNGQDYPLERLPQHVVQALEATEPGASTKNIVRMTREQRDIVFEDAKRHAKGVLYHLQNFVHERAPDKVHTFRRFQLSSEFGTADQLPPKPYIRESLRLKAMYMMREQDGRNRDGETKDQARERFAHVMYPDGLFAWQFHYDFHRTGRTYLANKGTNGPWIDYHKPNRHTRFLSDRSVFPLRSLIPRDMDGLIGAQKNLGYSSIVSAAIRLHDQCIAVGQAAAAIAAVSQRRDQQPAELVYDRSALEAVRHALCGEVEQAVPLLIWPFRDMRPEDSSYVAVNRLAAIGALPLDSKDVDFQPNEAAKDSWRNIVVARSAAAKRNTHLAPLPDGKMTRGEFCTSWWDTIRSLDDQPFVRHAVSDADADGIPDEDDPLLFTANRSIRFEIKKRTLPADADGALPGRQPGDLYRFNFSGRGQRSKDGLTLDHGDVFSDSVGFGWQRDLSANHRHRGTSAGRACQSFLFTRTTDLWQCSLPNGKYEVVVCVGDAEHTQHSQRVEIEDTVMLSDQTTRAGEFAEVSAVVEVTDGRLTMTIGSGKPGSNTCVNWLVIRKRS